MSEKIKEMQEALIKDIHFGELIIYGKNKNSFTLSLSNEQISAIIWLLVLGYDEERDKIIGLQNQLLKKRVKKLIEFEES